MPFGAASFEYGTRRPASCGLRDVARTRERERAAYRIELEAAFRRVRDDDDRMLALRRLDRRVRVMRQPMEDREHRQRREQAADHDLRLAPDAVGDQAAQQVERAAEASAPATSRLDVDGSTFSVCVRNRFM